jgi:hypothetical protein
MPRFRSVAPDGADLGPFVSSVPNWKAGDEIPLGAGRQYRVIAVVWSSDDQPTQLIVESAGARPSRRELAERRRLERRSS